MYNQSPALFTNNIFNRTPPMDLQYRMNADMNNDQRHQWAKRASLILMPPVLPNNMQMKRSIMKSPTAVPGNYNTFQIQPISTYDGI